MGTSQVSPQQLNIAARQLVLSQSLPMRQQIFSNTVATPGNTNNIVNVQPRYVGLIKGFWVKVVATVNNNDGSAAITPTDFGPANVLSNITLIDLNNNQRHNTPGWHMNFVNSIKARRVYDMAYTNSAMNSYPVNFGANFSGQNSATSSIAHGATGTVTMWYYVPVSYSETDLRGAIYANVVNATMQLQLTINPTPAVASGDSTPNIYTGSASVTLTNVTVTVYQDYLDQLPVANGQVVLPMLDLSTIYELKQTTFTAMVPNQDFPMQYSNFRDFISTFAVYYNGTARGTGSDIAYWALQAANLTNIFKNGPDLQALITRNSLQTDFPPGVYYFGNRSRPISTTQYGNMELVLNASTAGAGAYALIGYEDFALVSTVVQAGSLPAS